MSTFEDLFSNHAACYAMARPNYPAELFAYLASLTPRRRLAWDCGTGNGQAAVGLANHFEQVIATDASAAQLDQAAAHERIAYRVCCAEDPDLAPGTADLITVAQALHWFRLDEFYVAAGRVAATHGLIAAWCYTLPRCDPQIDAVCDRFYRDVVGNDWPVGRHWIDARYQTIPFPFREISPVPEFACRREWLLAEYQAYVESWSAVQRYRRRTGYDPLKVIERELTAAWGDPARRRPIAWPIHLRVGAVSDDSRRSSDAIAG